MSGTGVTTEVLPAISSVAAARALLPRVWAGEDVRAALRQLLDATGDIPGECAALSSEMAAASIAADRERGRAAANLAAQRGAEGGYPAWESIGPTVRRPVGPCGRQRGRRPCPDRGGGTARRRAASVR